MSNAVRHTSKIHQIAHGLRTRLQVLTKENKELKSISGLKSSSSALTALTKKADAVKAKADGMKTLADVQQKPIDNAKAVDKIRKQVAQGTTGGETTAQRLARLARK